MNGLSSVMHARRNGEQNNLVKLDLPQLLDVLQKIEQFDGEWLIVDWTMAYTVILFIVVMKNKIMGATNIESLLCEVLHDVAQDLNKTILATADA